MLNYQRVNGGFSIAMFDFRRVSGVIAFLVASVFITTRVLDSTCAAWFNLIAPAILATSHNPSLNGIDHDPNKIW